MEYDHRHTTGISDDGEAGTPRSARIFDDCGAVLIFRKIWLMVNFEALNSFLALNAFVCSMQKYTMRLPRSFWLGPRWEGIFFLIFMYWIIYEGLSVE